MRKLEAGARTSCIALMATLAACASTWNPGRTPMMSAAGAASTLSEGPRGLYIGPAEIANVGQETLQDVVLRLRPDWLRWGPTSRANVGPAARASVYTDGIYSGETDVLQTIPTDVVIDARYLPPVEARNRFGSACHCEGGVILVRTRRNGD